MPGAKPLSSVTEAARSGGILVGPEGGLSSSELKLLQDREFVKRVTISKNILRAETAAMAALAIVGSPDSQLLE